MLQETAAVDQEAVGEVGYEVQAEAAASTKEPACDVAGGGPTRPLPPSLKCGRITLVAWQRLLLVGQIGCGIAAAVVAAVGLFLVPQDASIPIHAGFGGFDNFAPRTRGLVTLTLLPLLVTGILVLGYWSSPKSRGVVSIVGFAAMLILLIFNIQAIRYGMRLHS